MRIHILSDLHVDFRSLVLPQVTADVMVLAGDVCPGKSALTWIRESCPERPVIFMLGNHEFYGCAVPKLIEDFRHMSAGTNIHVLENECLNIMARPANSNKTAVFGNGLDGPAADRSTWGVSSR